MNENDVERQNMRRYSWGVGVFVVVGIFALSRLILGLAAHGDAF